jgi:hypothetical protein
MRKVIVHFHIFKNAGSSIEVLLEELFATRMGRLEASRPEGVIFGAQLASYLSMNPQVAAVTSHTLRPPLPPKFNWQFFPLIFMRHPLDRAQSVYLFEKNQAADTLGSRQAARLSFREYVEWRLGPEGETVLKNAQVLVLSERQLLEADPQRAQAAAEDMGFARAFLAGVPVVGVVERFEESVRLFQDWLRPHFPELSLYQRAENAIRPVRPLEVKLAAIRAELGPELYRRLEEANAFDLELYRFASSKLSQAKSLAAGPEIPAEAAERTTERVFPFHDALSPWVRAFGLGTDNHLQGVCTVCGSQTTFRPFSENVRESGICTHCGSCNRHRQLGLLLRMRAKTSLEGPLQVPEFQKVLTLDWESPLAEVLKTRKNTVRAVCANGSSPQGCPSDVQKEDLSRLSQEDGSVDIVISSELMQKCKNPYGAHREISRILKRGGCHLFTVPFSLELFLDDLEKGYFGLEMLGKLNQLGFDTHAWNLSEKKHGIAGPGAVVFEATKI